MRLWQRLRAWFADWRWQTRYARNCHDRDRRR